MATRAIAVVPAAGRSERFGSMKLLADLDGEPLLSHTLRSLLDAGLASVVLVISPTASLDSVDLLRDPRVHTVTNPDPSRGMFSSIQTGLAVRNAGCFVVLPADMPFVSVETVKTTIEEAERRDQVVVPTYQGRHGHPLVLPGHYRRALLSMSPDISLKDALQSIAGPAHELDIDDPGVLRDVDTRKDLESRQTDFSSS